MDNPCNALDAAAHVKLAVGAEGVEVGAEGEEVGAVVVLILGTVGIEVGAKGETVGAEVVLKSVAFKFVYLGV